MQLIERKPISLPNNEAELMERFRKGDKAAFREIYDLLYEDIKSYYYKNYHNGNASDDHDIIAEAFYRVYKYKGNKESFMHVRRSIFTYVRNLCIDRFRFNKRTHQFLNEQPDEPIHINNYLLETDILQTVVINELIKLKRLTRGKVLYLIYLKGKTSWEITEILGISRQTVLNHKTRAIQAIKNSVSGLKVEPKNITEEIHQLFMVFQG